MNLIYIIIISISCSGGNSSVTLPSSYATLKECQIAAQMIRGQKSTGRHIKLTTECAPMYIKVIK